MISKLFTTIHNNIIVHGCAVDELVDILAKPLHNYVINTIFVKVSQVSKTYLGNFQQVCLRGTPLGDVEI